MHPSETAAHLLVRVLAYLLDWRENLEISPGIDTPDEPALKAVDPTGKMQLWVDVGSPAPRRLHKAGKIAKKVKVYAVKDSGVYLRELAKENVYRADEIEFLSFPSEFLKGLEATLERDNDWSVTVTGGTLYVTAGGRDLQGEVRRHSPEPRG